MSNTPSAVPLPLPDKFDPAAGLLFEQRGAARIHVVRDSAAWVAELLANGAQQDVNLGVRVLDAVLACQAHNTDDPHCGNFWWVATDGFVEDLNAVEFVLASLVPALCEFGNRLPETARARALDAVSLGLQEIERLDVAVAYTNIAAKDIANRILGGELLGDAGLIDRGLHKLRAWMRFTAGNGAPFEFNSPTYYRVTLRALITLARLTGNNEARVRAEAMKARIGLTFALHVHSPTGRLAGPHSRAYQPGTTAEDEPDIDQFMRWIEVGGLPDWLSDALTPGPRQVRECAHAAGNVHMTTWLTPQLALGSATRSFGDQSNTLIGHFVRPGKRPGVLYTRYLLDDAWLGSFWHETDRSTSRNLLDQGVCMAVQDGPRAFVVCRPATQGHFGRAACVAIVTAATEVDELLVNGEPVNKLPVSLRPHDVIVVGSGDALVGLVPLQAQALGAQAPVTLAERDGDLVLECCNYAGPRKRFWELDPAGGFFQGYPRSGLFVEMADRGRWSDASAFARLLACGELHDSAGPAPARTRDGRTWQLRYTRGDTELGANVDLLGWHFLQRWNADGDLPVPALATDTAAQSADGEVRVGDAALRFGNGSGWLFNPGNGRVVAGYEGAPSGRELQVAGKTFELPRASSGYVICERGNVVNHCV